MSLNFENLAQIWDMGTEKDLHSVLRAVDVIKADHTSP